MFKAWSQFQIHIVFWFDINFVTILIQLTLIHFTNCHTHTEAVIVAVVADLQTFSTRRKRLGYSLLDHFASTLFCEQFVTCIMWISQQFLCLPSWSDHRCTILLDRVFLCRGHAVWCPTTTPNTLKCWIPTSAKLMPCCIQTTRTFTKLLLWKLRWVRNGLCFSFCVSEMWIWIRNLLFFLFQGCHQAIQNWVKSHIGLVVLLVVAVIVMEVSGDPRIAAWRERQNVIKMDLRRNSLHQVAEQDSCHAIRKSDSRF